MVNEVILVGRAVRDPELRRTGRGMPVAHFSVATNSRRPDADGETVEVPEFHDVEAWAKLGETLGQILRKGKLIYLRGHLRQPMWEQGRQRRRSSRIVAQDVRILANPRPDDKQTDKEKSDGVEGAGGK